MTKQEIKSKDAPNPTSPYSQGIQVGDFIFTSGQLPFDAEGNLAGETIEAQTRQALENVRAILEAAEASLDDVVKVTVHLANLDDFPAFNQVYADYFSEPRPTRTTVGSILKGFLVEIDAVAYVGA